MRSGKNIAILIFLIANVAVLALFIIFAQSALTGHGITMAIMYALAVIVLIGDVVILFKLLRNLVRNSAELTSGEEGSISIEKSALVSTAMRALRSQPGVNVQRLKCDVVATKDGPVMDVVVTAVPTGSDSLMKLAAQVQATVKLALESFTDHKVRKCSVDFIEPRSVSDVRAARAAVDSHVSAGAGAVQSAATAVASGAADAPQAATALVDDAVDVLTDGIAEDERAPFEPLSSQDDAATHGQDGTEAPGKDAMPVGSGIGAKLSGLLGRFRKDERDIIATEAIVQDGPIVEPDQVGTSAGSVSEPDVEPIEPGSVAQDAYATDLVESVSVDAHDDHQPATEAVETASGDGAVDRGPADGAGFTADVVEDEGEVTSR